MKILVLTNFDSTLYVNNMFRYGVHGYLLKTAAEDALVDALETIMRGDEYIDATLKPKMEHFNDRMKREVALKSTLSTREKEILQLIVNGYSGTQISEKLFLSEATVKNYRIRILLKLDVNNTAMLVKKALKLGLVD